MLADIYAAIRSTAAALLAYDANDDAGVVTALNTKSSPIQNHTLRNAKWLTTTFNKTNSALILNSFKAATDASAAADYYALVSSGIDLADADTRDNIDLIAAQFAWTNALKNNLKEKGRHSISPAVQRIGRDVTLQDIIDVRAYDTTVFQKQQLSSRWAAVYNTLNTEINEATLTTMQQLRDRVTSLLA